MKSGNADGAKGYRFEIMEKGNTALHREDYARDNQTRPFHTKGACRT